MLRAFEEYRRASGPILVVVLMGVISTLLGAGLIWAFGKLADWWWAVLAAALVLTVTISSLRAWYREWKRAEEERGRADEAVRSMVGSMEQASQAEHALAESRPIAAALRLITEYLAVLPRSLPQQRLALHLIPFSSRLIKALPEDQREGTRGSPIESAHSTILTIKLGKDCPESVDEAIYAIAAFYDLGHLIPWPPAGPPLTTSGS